MKHTGILRVAVNGAFFDTQVEEGFSLKTAIDKIRADGFFFNGACFIPYPMIQFITLVPSIVTERMDAQMEAQNATKN